MSETERVATVQMPSTNAKAPSLHLKFWTVDLINCPIPYAVI